MSHLSYWSFPTRVVFGAGAIAELGAELKSEGVTSALLVSDAGVRAAGLLEPALSALAAKGISASIFDGVAGNPVERNVRDGLDAYRAADANALVAVGGGSAMDVAKIVALAVNHQRPLIEYDDAAGGGQYIDGEVPLIAAVPTTAGTGSEVGRSGVVTLESNERKTVIFSPKLLPRVAICDPEMTRSMPPAITAATGYDALTHCIEALVATGDHPMADAIALGGIALAAGALERAVHQGDDLDARGDMMKAAMMGAVAFQKGLGACHSLAHPLSSICGLHHGFANALCLPTVVRFNRRAAETEKPYAEVARLLTGEPNAARCADALADLRTRIGIVSGLAAAGVREDQCDVLADAAFEDGCHASNPRPCSRDDLWALYRDAF